MTQTKLETDKDIAAVSFGDEPLILVDAADTPQGFASKEACHRLPGMLHRAFSIFIYNSKGEVLIHQRAPQKPLWPGFWTNSCCSHPRRGESVEGAATRRLYEELGVACGQTTPLYSFEYRAEYSGQDGKPIGVEHEYCHVLLARSEEAEIVVHPQEVQAFEFVAPAKLDRAIEEEPLRFTPWCRLEWQAIRGEWAKAVADWQAG